MLITVREASASPLCFFHHSNLSHLNSKPSPRLNKLICRASFSVRRKPNTTKPLNLALPLLSNSCEGSVFDPLGINSDGSSGLNSVWESFLSLFSQTYESASSAKKEKPTSARGVAAAIEDSNIDFGDFFKGPLPGKFLKLLGYLALSRLGIYIPLGGVNTEAFLGNLDQNSLLSTLDTFSGGGIGRLGICSLGIVPFINAQIVFQLLAQIYPKLQDLQKREGEAGRKKILQYTRYASVGFAIVQAIGQVLYLRPYANDFSTQWVVTSVTLLTLGSVFTTYIGEQISDLKLGNGTSLLIFTSIISYLPASFGRTAAQAFQDGNYVGLIATIVSFVLLVLSIVYVQEAERKIPLNYASRYTSKSGGLQKSAYLPFKVNSSGVMPIIFSTSSLALPGTLARFTGLNALKNAALALNPGVYPNVVLAAGVKKKGKSLASKSKASLHTLTGPTEAWNQRLLNPWVILQPRRLDNLLNPMITERELLDRMNSSLNNQKIQTAQIDRPPEVLQPPSVALAREFFERDYEPQDAADDITEREKYDMSDERQVRFARMKLMWLAKRWWNGVEVDIRRQRESPMGTWQERRQSFVRSACHPITKTKYALDMEEYLQKPTAKKSFFQPGGTATKRLIDSSKGSLYLPTNILLIAFFNYYYTFLQLDPDDVSEQLKRQGASIPLVRPGKSTAAFIKTVLSRISVLGSGFLAILAAGPALIEQTTHLTAFRGFAGTSVLILVGCATDTARKVQAEIISQKYKNIEFYDIDKYGP
uniref:CpSecY n=1 Tax=Fagus sylvatica TaxID=28930 RepID=A0A2N9HC02_FAGSY